MPDNEFATEAQRTQRDRLNAADSPCSPCLCGFFLAVNLAEVQNRFLLLRSSGFACLANALVDELQQKIIGRENVGDLGSGSGKLVSRLLYEPWDVDIEVFPRTEKEWADNNRFGTSRDALGIGCADGRFCHFHVGRLDNVVLRGESIREHPGDLNEQIIALIA